MLKTSELRRRIQRKLIRITGGLLYGPRMVPRPYGTLRFEEVIVQTRDLWKELEGLSGRSDVQPWIHPFWKTKREEFRKLIVEDWPPDFLTSPLLQGTMVAVGWGPEQQFHLSRITDSTPDFQKFLAAFRESRVGGPTLDCLSLGLSSSTVLGLYHLSRLELAWRILGDDKMLRCIEVGGGYGNLARIIMSAVKNATYVIVDFGELLCIQHLFLRLNCPQRQIHAVVSSSDGIKDGAINLVPIDLLRDTPLSGDLFVSTFALTETPDAFQRYVAHERQYFNCRRTYIAGSHVDFDGKWTYQIPPLIPTIPHCSLQGGHNSTVYELLAWNDANSPVSDSGIYDCRLLAERLGLK